MKFNEWNDVIIFLGNQIGECKGKNFLTAEPIVNGDDRGFEIIIKDMSGNYFKSFCTGTYSNTNDLRNAIFMLFRDKINPEFS